MIPLSENGTSIPWLAVQIMSLPSSLALLVHHTQLVFLQWIEKIVFVRFFSSTWRNGVRRHGSTTMGEGEDIRPKLTVTDGKNHCAVHHSWYSVSHGDHSAVCKLGPYSFLQNQVGCIVDRCSCFIKNQYPASSQEGTPQTEELPLPHAPVWSTFRNWNKQTLINGYNGKKGTPCVPRAWNLTNGA